MRHMADSVSPAALRTQAGHSASLPLIFATRDCRCRQSTISFIALMRPRTTPARRRPTPASRTIAPPQCSTKLKAVPGQNCSENETCLLRQVKSPSPLDHLSVRRVRYVSELYARIDFLVRQGAVMKIAKDSRANHSHSNHFDHPLTRQKSNSAETKCLYDTLTTPRQKQNPYCLPNSV